MHHNSNRIKSLIERRLLTPAYVGMLAGLLVRSVALVLSVAIPYGTWPMLVKILIEGAAALGMIGCADIVLSAASASAAAIDRQIDSVRNRPDYQPNPRLAKERYEQVKAALDAKRDLVLAGLGRERRKEWGAVLFCGAVTVSYGVLFGVTVLAAANWITVAVEVIGVATIPFVTWYISAQYKEEQAAPEEHAKSLSLMAVDQRLQAAHGHLASGAETPEDLALLDVATEASHYHNRLVRALRRPDRGVRYLTTPELYSLFGVSDSSGQAAIRRAVRKAGETHQHGVTRDAQTDAWLTPASALLDLFPGFIGTAGTTTRTQRTRASAAAMQDLAANRRAQQGEHEANNARTSTDAETASDGRMLEHGSDTTRTHAELETAPTGPTVPSAVGGYAGTFAALHVASDR